MGIKTAVIGLGIMGRRMVEHMETHPQFDVVSIWAPDPVACNLSAQLARNQLKIRAHRPQLMLLIWSIWPALRNLAKRMH